MFTTRLHLAPRLKKEWSYTSTPSLALRGLLYNELYLTDLIRKAAVYWVNDKGVPLLNSISLCEAYRCRAVGV